MTAYLDHAATTPMRRSAFEAMVPFLSEHTGNPTGSHSAAREARKAIDDARDVIAAAFGADPSEIIFTSGGTEADNLAVSGIGGNVICSAIEHHAVLEPVAARSASRTIPVLSDGTVDLEALATILDDSVTLVSVMLANNETGVVQPLHKVARLVRKLAPNALVHTDAVQATPWLDVANMTQFADLISVSAHKLGGPQGVGALIARKNPKLTPMLLGGGQERERRSGTHNVAGIVAFAAALEECSRERENAVVRVAGLRDRLVSELSAIPGARHTAPESDRLPSIAHFCFDGIESEALVVLLDDAGICASAGASCSSGALEQSHVLSAMGIPANLANGALRLSLGWSSTESDVDLAIKVIPDAIERLR